VLIPDATAQSRKAEQHQKKRRSKSHSFIYPHHLEEEIPTFPALFKVLTKLLLLPIKRCFTIFQANFKKEMDE
jgi:hypothetical protein